MNTILPRDAKPGGIAPWFIRPVCFALAGTGMILFFAIGKFYRPTVDESLTPRVVITSQLGPSLNSSGSAIEIEGANALAVSATAANSSGNRITAGISQSTIDTAEHPIDPLLTIAELALTEIEQNVQDYSATLSSQVFFNGKLQEEKYLFCKIRHARAMPAGKAIPFSVYTKFLKPQSLVGQEAIWVDGWHQGNLVAHIGGWGNVMRFYLDPDGSLAMEGNRYPVQRGVAAR